MTLKQSLFGGGVGALPTRASIVSRAVRSLKVGVAGISVLVTAGGLTAGCLDRPVSPATPRTSNLVVKTVTQSGVDKIDLLFMIDNSISMADKQAILADAVPVLVQRLVDPICTDADGNPTNGTASTPCGGGSQPEFTPIKNIHVGVITSSLGSHGGEVCVDDPTAMPPRTLNDKAQLVSTVRTPMLYFWPGAPPGAGGFLVWDPRMGMDRPAPADDKHQPLSNHEQVVADFVADFRSHVVAAGERGCGYESSLESWYRFLIDPEPVTDMSNNGQVNVRGAINQVVLDQRAAFMRPDSLLAVVMLSDENDCSINDEDGAQGWLVGRRTSMPRGSDACSHPENPDVYRCCIPCVVLDDPNFVPAAGCGYGGDAACNGAGGHSLTTIEDSTNLRCFNQVRRFGVNLLYPWWRYRDALQQPRIRLRPPNDGTEVTNPIFMPGADGTPAREPNLVFLAGIIGVPWQDIATQASLGGAGLTYLTAAEMRDPRDANDMPWGTNRWDVILGDPDLGRLPTDPHMLEQVEERTGTNPVPGVTATLAPSTTANNTRPDAINGHEQNIVNRDDLQYACIFDLEPDSACTTANQDACDCNQSEQAYNRPLCNYTGMADGTQVFAKAYPGTRHLQVLKGFGDNAIVASICPKNAMRPGNPAQDPNYGYNPAVGAIINRLKEALIATCLPRPLSPDETDDSQVACKVVEAFQPTTAGACACTDPGRADLGGKAGIRTAVEEELKRLSLCGGSSGFDCNDYCMCEIQQFTGDALNTCQNVATPPADIYGYCYVDSTTQAPELLADCPDTQQQIIRFLGTNVPRQRAIALIACLGASATSQAPDAGM